MTSSSNPVCYEHSHVFPRHCEDSLEENVSWDQHVRPEACVLLLDRSVARQRQLLVENLVIKNNEKFFMHIYNIKRTCKPVMVVSLSNDNLWQKNAFFNALQQDMSAHNYLKNKFKSNAMLQHSNNEMCFLSHHFQIPRRHGVDIEYGEVEPRLRGFGQGRHVLRQGRNGLTRIHDYSTELLLVRHHLTKFLKLKSGDSQHSANLSIKLNPSSNHMKVQWCGFKS